MIEKINSYKEMIINAYARYDYETDSYDLDGDEITDLLEGFDELVSALQKMNITLSNPREDKNIIKEKIKSYEKLAYEIYDEKNLGYDLDIDEITELLEVFDDALSLIRAMYTTLIEQREGK